MINSRFSEEYKRKLISAEEAAGLVKSDSWIEFGFNSGYPKNVDEALVKRKDELERVKVRVDWIPGRVKILESDPNQEHFIVNAYFITKHLREYVKTGVCVPIPRGFADGPKCYREYLKDNIDIVFLTVTPMERNGYFNFGAACGEHKALCEAAKMVVVEVNESMPWIYGGYDEVIHISEIDHIVENKKYLIDETSTPEPNEVQIQIARNVAEYIEDGATLQLGVGAIPNVLCQVLLEKGVKDLGIHTEKISEGMIDLMEAGVVNNKMKSAYKGKTVFGFAGGSRKLFDYLDHNPAFATCPVDYVNNPFVIAQNYKQFSLNSALRIDLAGQVNAESIGTVQVSGSGGQLDFTRGAYESPGGKAFIVFPSTYTDKQGQLHSNIVPLLGQGDIVTDPRNDVSYVGTEYGIVNLRTRSMWERVHLLTSIAHPKFRDELREEAMKLKYLTPVTAKLPIDW